MTPELNEKLANLRQIIRSCDSVLVAYSGGVDSALVMVIAHQELQARALACIGVSPSYPTREMRAAIEQGAFAEWRERFYAGIRAGEVA